MQQVGQYQGDMWDGGAGRRINYGAAARYVYQNRGNIQAGLGNAYEYGKRAGRAAVDAYNSRKRARNEMTVSGRGSRWSQPSSQSSTASYRNNPSVAKSFSYGYGSKSGAASARFKHVTSKKVYKKSKQSRTSGDIVMDIVCPPCEENYREPGNQLDWIANKQDVKEYFHMDVAKVRQLINKCRDVSNIAFTSAVANDRSNARFKYTGGRQVHTFFNNCSHHVTLKLIEWGCKVPTSSSPLALWTDDLANDEPLLNVQNPINIEQTVNTSKVYPKTRQRGLYYFYKNLNHIDIELPPGEKYEYVMKLDPFEYDEGTFNLDVNAAACTVQKFTKFLMAIGVGQEVTSSVETSVTTGSGHIAHFVEEFNYFRAQPPTKFVNRFASGTWGDIALQASEQAMNTETDAQDGAYAEDV